MVTVVKNPNRYTGIFRLSNAKTKLIQNVTQSREIKFGDFMEEICAYLLKNKQERSNEILYIPDFDTSEEIFLALKKLKRCEPTLYRKLISNTPAYAQLRNELFPTKYNLNRV